MDDLCSNIESKCGGVGLHIMFKHFSCTSAHPLQGQIQRLKKGGHTQSGVDADTRRAQHAEFFLCERIMHSILGGSGGMLPY